MAVVITSFTAGSGDEITVGFELCDGSEQSSVKHTIPISVYTELGLAKGECSTELYCRVAREAGIHAAFKRGGYILGFGACSVNMLVSKLISKGFEKCVAVINGETASIVVKCSETLTPAQLAQINASVYEVAGIEPVNITIVGRK